MEWRKRKIIFEVCIQKNTHQKRAVRRGTKNIYKKRRTIT